MSAPAAPPLRRFDGLDAALIGATVIGSIFTLAVLAIPGFHGHVMAPSADLALDSVALVVTTAVAALSWARYRERREAIALVLAAAFLVLAISNVAAVAVAVGGNTGASASIAAIGENQLFVWAAARALGAGLLVIGGIESLRGGHPGHPRGFVLGAAGAMVIVIGAVLVLGDRLTASLSHTAPGSAPSDLFDLVLTPAGIVAQLVVAVLFLTAAVVSRLLWRRDRVVGDAYLALGLAVAAVAEVHDAFFPSEHPEQVSTADLLRLVFYVVLFMGIQAEARSMMAALRGANQSLASLRDADVERAALQERARLSRELHDGLAQDLWLAKLKIGRLAASSALSPEDRTLAEEVTRAVDMGLAEARQGVMALRDSADASESFAAVLQMYLDDAVDRFGVPVELDCQANLPALSSRTKADLLRIVQEALSNATHHADATSIRVRVAAEDGGLFLAVSDNGHGFDPEDLAAGHVGLEVMRERAATIGATLTIKSSPHGGTRVAVLVPVGADEKVRELA